MNIAILGGPHDGASIPVPTDISEGDKFMVHGVEYFFNKPKDKAARLIYYVVSRE